jgi:hypothetical protein
MDMDDAQIKRAIEHNKSRGHTEEQVRCIQMVVGAKEDGIWGPRTVQSIADWQESRALPVDGMVHDQIWKLVLGEKTSEVDPEPPIPKCDSPILGIWCDDTRMIQKPESWDELLEHGITSVALMYEGHNEKFNPFYSYDAIEKICRLAKDRNMVVGLTDWPWPTKQWMEDAERVLRRMFDPDDMALPLAFYESDVEGNWLPPKVKGFANIDKAGDELVKMKTRVVTGTTARRETTSFTAHTENGRQADVAPWMDAVFNQAYAVRNRAKKDPKTGKYNLNWPIPWDHTYGPGNMVKHTLDRSLQIPGIDDGEPKLGAGLAAYDQSWPGHTAVEAMTKSYDAAVGYGVFEIRWWSYKWIFGRHSTGYGRKFLKSILK